MSFLRVYPTQMLLSADWIALPKLLVIITVKILEVLKVDSTQMSFISFVAC